MHVLWFCVHSRPWLSAVFTDWPAVHMTLYLPHVFFLMNCLFDPFTWVVVVATKAESLGYILLELLPLTHQGAIQHCGQ